MPRSQLNRRFARFLQGVFGRGEARTQPRTRGPTAHVIIIDGTMSSLKDGCESNAGLAYKLLEQQGSQLSVYYAPGIQWSHWSKLGDVIAGRGINRQIRRAYGWLASRYRPGDRIFLIGYSRGAYAVRSLAGIIDRIGLLRADAATQRNLRDIYRHYQTGPDTDAARAFGRVHCYPDAQIEMIGAWDTVKSLGINAPLLWRFSVPKHAFHNHWLGPSVKRGYHALARHETRVAYSPVMWQARDDWDGDLQQMWFRGTHGDVGGMLGGYNAARPLSNIPFVWLMSKAAQAGLPLPNGWQHAYPQDPTAPSSGTFRGIGRWLITRRARKVGMDPSERVHPSVRAAPVQQGWAWPGRAWLRQNLEN